MKKAITNLVQKTKVSPLGVLLFFLIFTSIHLVAFLSGEYALLRLFYPLLFVSLIARAYFDQ